MQSINKIASWKLARTEAGDRTSRELANHVQVVSLRTVSSDSFLFVRPPIDPSKEWCSTRKLLVPNFHFLVAQLFPEPHEVSDCGTLLRRVRLTENFRVRK
jgi:hypothetical protein